MAWGRRQVLSRRLQKGKRLRSERNSPKSCQLTASKQCWLTLSVNWDECEMQSNCERACAKCEEEKGARHKLRSHITPQTVLGNALRVTNSNSNLARLPASQSITQNLRRERVQSWAKRESRDKLNILFKFNCSHALIFWREPDPRATVKCLTNSSLLRDVCPVCA